MRNIHRLAMLATPLLAGSLLLSAACPALSAEPFAKAFSYFAAGQELGTVLTAFARTQGYGASVGPDVTGKVSGHFDKVPPRTFLDGMAAAFDVGWYTVGRTVHFYDLKKDERTAITPQMMTAQDALALLKGNPAVSPELPPRVAADGKTLIIHGPKAYTSRLAELVATYEASRTDRTVIKVFPLKYAWAENISVSSMDKTVTIPGIAAILRAMITGEQVTGSSVTQSRAKSDGLRGKGLSAQGETPKESQRAESDKEKQPQAGGANVMADPRMNAVIVNDAAYRMPYYAQVIKDLDKPVELVEIHAAIVDIDSNFTRDLGVQYQGNYTKSSGWGGGGQFSTASTQSAGSETQGVLGSAGLALSTIYTHGSDFFMARVTALESTGDAKVLARPSVLTVDNVQATLENTTSYYIPISGQESSDLFKVETGTVLRVTPHIIQEQDQTAVKLVVNIQDDQKDNANNQTTDSSGKTTLNSTKQTKVNTQAIIGAGQSLLIGGYSHEEKTTSDSGIPLLKDIPLLGYLFKNHSKATKRMERLILLTPRIISLNDLPNIPERVNEPSFVLSPTQGDYEPQPMRPTPTPRGGCARHGGPAMEATAR